MRRQVKLPVQMEGSVRSPAGVKDPVAYNCLKSIIDKMTGGMFTDVNPENPRVKEGSALGGKVVDNLLKMSEGLAQTAALSDETSEETATQLSDLGTPLPSTGTGGGTELPDGSAQYQVLSWDGSAWIADWPRFHA